MGLNNRLKRIERTMKATSPTLITYYCIIDGKPEVMTYLEYFWATKVEGKQGELGKIAGAVTIEPLEQNELEKIMNDAIQEYNSPEAIAQRQAEYEELQRIGELRRIDFQCGRDMDKCHPLPWQNRS